MKLEKELQEIVDELKINIISTIEQVDEIYDYELMIVSNDLVVRKEKSEQINIILFDTDVYNSTYLLDEFKNYIDEEGELLEHFKIHYCNNLSVYKTLFEKYLKKHGFVDLNKSTDTHLVMKQIENIVPVVLVIDGFEEEILIEIEQLHALTANTFSNLINTLG